MKKHLTAAFFLINTMLSNAQLVINTTQTPSQIVQNTLLGAGITAFNIKFNGASNLTTTKDQISSFSTGFTPTNLGIGQGVILATGKTTVAIGPNNTSGASLPTSISVSNSDVDLLTLASPNVLNKAAVLEFDFVASFENLSFNFIFASEEYPEFSTSSFNDVFGVFISGAGISGPFSLNSKNIAILPSSSTGNNVVSINNINNGISNTGPCINCNYYVNNTTSAFTIQYDGFTTEIIANTTIQVGQTYHVKIAIANVADNLFDSALFIKANSFKNTSLGETSFKKNNLSMFPNPAKNKILFKPNQIDKNLKSLKIFDLYGKKVKTFENIDFDNPELDISDLKNGIYLVEIEYDNAIKFQLKLIKE